jgi:hypothetical protein
MLSTGMALLITPRAGGDYVLRSVGAAVGLRYEMFCGTPKMLDQPKRYAQFLGMQPAASFPHEKPAIEALAVLFKKRLSAKLNKTFVPFRVHWEIHLV